MAKIMLVEDDNNLREIYQARLAAEGYEIVSAKDGEEALAIAVKEKPDLIVCDVMMPKVSGFEMLDILRSTAGIKNTKVIMMTALSQAEDRQRAEKLGADKYLVKSQVTLEDMAKTVKDVLDSEKNDASMSEDALLSKAANTLSGGETPDSKTSEESKANDDDDAKIGRKNIIQPLHDMTAEKSNINDLIAKEEAKENLGDTSASVDESGANDSSDKGNAADSKKPEDKKPDDKLAKPTTG